MILGLHVDVPADTFIWLRWSFRSQCYTASQINPTGRLVEAIPGISYGRTPLDAIEAFKRLIPPERRPSAIAQASARDG